MSGNCWIFGPEQVCAQTDGECCRYLIPVLKTPSPVDMLEGTSHKADFVWEDSGGLINPLSHFRASSTQYRTSSAQTILEIWHSDVTLTYSEYIFDDFRADISRFICEPLKRYLFKVVHFYDGCQITMMPRPKNQERLRWEADFLPVNKELHHYTWKTKLVRGLQPGPQWLFNLIFNLLFICLHVFQISSTQVVLYSYFTAKLLNQSGLWKTR